MLALSIKDPETDRLAPALAETAGESLTEAIRVALAERLARESRRSQRRVSAGSREADTRRWVPWWVSDELGRPVRSDYEWPIRSSRTI
jgi:antitoxin VapB